MSDRGHDPGCPTLMSETPGAPADLPGRLVARAEWLERWGDAKNPTCRLLREAAAALRAGVIERRAKGQ